MLDSRKGVSGWVGVYDRFLKSPFLANFSLPSLGVGLIVWDFCQEVVKKIPGTVLSGFFYFFFLLLSSNTQLRGNNNVGECAKKLKRKNRKYPGVNHSAGNCCSDRGEWNGTEKVRSFPFSGSACFFSKLAT